MAKVQPYKVTKEIDGVKYTAQFSGASMALQALDAASDGNGGRSEMKYAEFLLKNIVVNPKNIDMDAFDTYEKLSNVTTFAASVMRGELADEKDTDK